MIKVVRRFGRKVSFLARLRALPGYMVDREVSIVRKGAVIAGLFYAVWPVDALPDTIPLIGWMDDLGLLALLYLFMKRELGQYITRRKLEG
jgi:uncharacterized membrane protein YkvA (DUF1232 family)